MQTEFQEPDICIATRGRIFLDTKSVRSFSTLNTAEYQVPQSHWLVRLRKRGERLRCALVFGRVRVGYTVRHCRVRVVCGLENLWSY